MTKQKKSFLDRIVGAGGDDLEESINLEQDLKKQVEEVSIEQVKQNDEKEKVDRELDDASKKQIKKDMMTESGKESPEEKKEKWMNDAESLKSENGEEGQLAIDVYQTAKDIVIKSIVGGVKSEELDISINNDMVTIKGVRQNPDEVASEDYYYQECFWGSFSRSVILPTEVDVESAEAAMKEGILTVKLPKIKKTVSKKITVK
jgi:HSP20 family protein